MERDNRPESSEKKGGFRSRGERDRSMVKPIQRGQVESSLKVKLPDGKISLVAPHVARDRQLKKDKLNCA
jgi:hypothetical protein